MVLNLAAVVKVGSALLAVAACHGRLAIEVRRGLVGRVGRGLLSDRHGDSGHRHRAWSVQLSR